jgi:AcrR family transcriptional regulator
MMATIDLPIETTVANRDWCIIQRDRVRVNRSHAMATSREEAPATGASARTRALLMRTARELLQTGGPLTVQAVAERARVSRATAYRYFPNNESVALHATMPLSDDPLSEPDWADTAMAGGPDLPSRAAALVRRMGEWAFDHERELRMLLRLSLTDGSGPPAVLRRPSTSRVRWIGALLSDLPDTVATDAKDRLAVALIPLFGSDAVVWLTDMAGLEREAALRQLEWMASTLVAATLAESSVVDRPGAGGPAAAGAVQDGGRLKPRRDAPASRRDR